MLQVKNVRQSPFEYNVSSTSFATATRYLRLYGGFIGSLANETFGGYDIFLYNSSGKVLRVIKGLP